MSSLGWRTAVFSLGLAVFAATALSAQPLATPPDFSSDFTGWVGLNGGGPFYEAAPDREPGPIVSDPMHPFIPNGADQQPSFRIADLSNSNLMPWVKEKMKQDIDEILAVEGIDVFFLARVDLSKSLGYRGDKRHPEVRAMVDKLIARAVDDKMKLAPFMGIGCPGLIDEHGTILKGGQNLPGNWEGTDFNLAVALGKRLPRIGDHDIFIQLHNDAVVQGLSEVPNMKDVRHWGVMTIGTGLGNARFTNRTD